MSLYGHSWNMFGTYLVSTNIKKRNKPLHFSQITLEFQKTYFLKIFIVFFFCLEQINRLSYKQQNILKTRRTKLEYTTKDDKDIKKLINAIDKQADPLNQMVTYFKPSHD